MSEGVDRVFLCRKCLHSPFSPHNPPHTIVGYSSAFPSTVLRRRFGQTPHTDWIDRVNMSAIFDFSSLLTCLLLLIATCTYLRDMRPTIFDAGQVRTDKNAAFNVNVPVKEWNIHQFPASFIFPALVSKQTLQPGETRLKRSGVTGFFWKMSRIGERLSPYVGASCAIMAIHLLFFKWKSIYGVLLFWCTIGEKNSKPDVSPILIAVDNTIYVLWWKEDGQGCVSNTRLLGNNENWQNITVGMDNWQQDSTIDLFWIY